MSDSVLSVKLGREVRTCAWGSGLKKTDLIVSILTEETVVTSTMPREVCDAVYEGVCSILWWLYDYKSGIVR